MTSGIGNIHGIAQSISTAPRSPLAFSSVGKLHVPVSPALVIYSQFEHVAGVPARNNESAVNISKIKILNTLIDRLIDMKQQPTTHENQQDLSDAQIDTLIKDYQTKIKNTIATAQINPYALGGGAPPQVGMFFSITS